MDTAALAMLIFFMVLIFLRLSYWFHILSRKPSPISSSCPQDTSIEAEPTIDKVMAEIGKPIRFSSQQLKMATQSFSHLLGTGGYGSVYKGSFSCGTLVAVKVLNKNSDKRMADQFLAEVLTIGRTHHINLVQLYGFCFDNDLVALIYEYMENSSLDRLLFNRNENIEWLKLYDIAIGTAKGIAYLHEDCQQKIIHYDIKPENIVLDGRFCPKVADFGLAKLCNREKSCMTLTQGRGTPGYAAPELWMPYPVTCKCDVYSFGMLLFEILGRRRNLDFNLTESQEWFPKWVWKKFEKGELVDVFYVCGIQEKDREKGRRMIMVALWCAQFKPEVRPCMSLVVKMLEGGDEIPFPKNPFQHFMPVSPFPGMGGEVNVNVCVSDTESSQTSTSPGVPSIPPSPVMRKYEISMSCEN